MARAGHAAVSDSASHGVPGGSAAPIVVPAPSTNRVGSLGTSPGVASAAGTNVERKTRRALSLSPGAGTTGGAPGSVNPRKCGAERCPATVRPCRTPHRSRSSQAP